ncbi:15347_t:CDS:1, partial [Gigaspora rosea]
ISHAIKRYLRIGNNIDSGEKISLAIENLQGTSVAHIEPCRDHVAIKTMNKILKLFYWKWPITGEFAGFVQGQALPNIGKWVQFSPEDLMRLVECPIHKPTPIASEHSQPKKPWTIPVPNNN